MNKRFLIGTLVVLSLAPAAFSQVRPARTADPAKTDQEVPAKLPEKIAVEYKGGIYGFSDKEKGFLTFDTINERVVFSDRNGKEQFSIPYEAIKVVYPSQKKVRSGTGRAIGALPLPGAAIGGMFMKKKKNYLVVQYEDPEVDVAGTANFLVDTAEELTGAIHAIGQNAEMTQRGDSYIRRRSP